MPKTAKQDAASEATSGVSGRPPAVLVLTDKLVESARSALQRIDDAVGMLDAIDRLLIMSIGISKNKDQAAMLEAALAVLTRVREQASACDFDSGAPCLNSSIATISYAIRDAKAEPGTRGAA